MRLASSAAAPRPLSYIERYVDRLERAKAFLRERHYSVVRVDREAAIASWFVSGWNRALSNEEVVTLAVARGMDEVQP